ncbi:MAG: hypothetical protein EZS28_050263, partial [Streblomastix strix]
MAGVRFEIVPFVPHT